MKSTSSTVYRRPVTTPTRVRMTRGQLVVHTCCFQKDRPKAFARDEAPRMRRRAADARLGGRVELGDHAASVLLVSGVRRGALIPTPKTVRYAAEVYTVHAEVHVALKA